MDLDNISLGSISLESYPNSIQIIGDFKARVGHIEHPNLTKYVECFSDKNERITLVFESLPSDKPEDLEPLLAAKQLLDALNYLHNRIDCVHGLITPKCLVWSDNLLKLGHWPINLLTGGGASLGASCILPRNISYIAPEQVKFPQSQANKKCDIWSAGLTLLKLIKTDVKIPENPCGLAFCDSAEKLISQLNGQLSGDIIENSSAWNKFFERILDANPEKRASLDELYAILDLDQPPKVTLPFLKPIVPNLFEIVQERLSKLQIAEIYYLWRLSIGRNLESEQKQDDCPPIFQIPKLILSEKPSNIISEVKLKNYEFINLTPKIIPLSQFKSFMSQLDEKIFSPLIITEDQSTYQSEVSNEKSPPETNTDKNECNNNRKLTHSNSFTFADLDNLTHEHDPSIASTDSERSKVLPIVIKEADCAYQCQRIVLFKRLLAGCPYLKEELKREASVDIPPYYRAEVWAELLNVPGTKDRQLYESIDKNIALATDRQISVDIPRCHQYNELMASPQGHQKLARILKAWLNHNSSEYVYWQGLDSLAAPFLLLNFHDEATAFACFNAFVDKYLKGFFKKDNQAVVHQYLSMFSELLSYHDPTLAMHLESLGFLPNLYAIPWFLTMFTHVLPLHKVLHVWDCLLLGDEKYPVCVGLAILNQLKHELLDFGFNDCIVAFSNLPEIDIERCIRDATNFYKMTPDRKWA